jgi:nitrite reductase/ring-hydroxylating ferredoxin subunit
MDDDARIAPVSAVPEDGSLLFTVRDGEGTEHEAILLRTDGGVAGWRNQCQHFTHVALDKGSGAPVRDGEVVCANHGAMFDAATGRCTYGPCEGAYLADVSVVVADEAVYLDDPAYEFVGRGGVETDPADLSSTSNVEF